MIGKHTPIKDRLTNEPIFLGDLVENEQGLCGVLVWDEYFNRYIIKTEHGGNIYARTYTKIKKLNKNIIDTNRIECRKRSNKKKW